MQGSNLPLFIAIDGSIGSGKTEFAKRLALRMRWACVREDTAHHPFIKDFYANPEFCAMETEITFVLMHRHALRQAMVNCTPDSGIVADFSLQKDPLFASITLGKEELDVFMQVYALAGRDVPGPDLLIYLRGTPEALIERIRRRGRPMEKDIPVSYIEELNRKYEAMVASRPASSTIIFNIEKLDWTLHKTALPEAITEVAQMLTKLLQSGQ